MSPVFFVLLIVLIYSTAKQYNSTQINKLYGKADDSQSEGIKALGFLYKLGTYKPICGVALIDHRIAVTDGSCVSVGSNLSNIFIAFNAVTNPSARKVYDVDNVKHIEEWNYISLVILLLAKEVKETNNISPIDLWNQRYVSTGPGVIIRWNKYWEIVVDNVIVPATNAENSFIFLMAHNNNHLPYGDNRGHLVVGGSFLLGISFLTQGSVQSIIYFSVGSIYNKIRYEMAELRKKPTVKFGQERKMLIRQHLQKQQQIYEAQNIARSLQK